jgi:hypothetical protein
VDRISREIVRAQKFSVIPKDASKLTSRLKFFASDKVPAEISRFNSSLLTVFAVALAEAADQYPEVFGKATGSKEVTQNIAELQARQQELFAKIQADIPTDELDFGDYRQGRATPARFKNTPVEVAPPQTAGQRLVAFLMSQRGKQ